MDSSQISCANDAVIRFLFIVKIRDKLYLYVDLTLLL